PARPRARPHLPPAGGPRSVQRDRGRPPQPAAAGAASLRSRPGQGPARGRPPAAGPHRRTHRPRRRPLRAGRPGSARCARIGALGRVHAAAPSIPHSTRAGRARTVTTAQAYAEVERLTRKRARNFAYGIMVLPREKRRAIAAIYAWARRVDDIADGDLPVNEKRAQLESLRSALNVDVSDDPMLVALADARSRFPIPTDALRALVEGGLQDLDQRRYPTFEELEGYCSKVAGAVGVACVAVYGSDDVEHA